MALHKHHTCYSNPQVAGDMNQVYIGKYCSIADSVMFDSGIQHNPRFVTTYPLWVIGAPENREGMCRGDIYIGSDVWIGDGVLVMSGVTIGDGAIIGARSVVTHNVPPYEIWAGAPAKYKKPRFWPVIVQRLLKVKWWDLPTERIRELGPLMLSTDIETFLREVEK